MLGEVEFSRRVYVAEDGAGMNEYVYLLDEVLGIDTPGQISPMLSEMVATAACESTYRETARQVSELTGQTISHQTAWSITQGWRPHPSAGRNTCCAGTTEQRNRQPGKQDTV
jgi:hypothetical protein